MNDAQVTKAIRDKDSKIQELEGIAASERRLREQQANVTQQKETTLTELKTQLEEKSRRLKKEREDHDAVREQAEQSRRELAKERSLSTGRNTGPGTQERGSSRPETESRTLAAGQAGVIQDSHGAGSGTLVQTNLATPAATLYAGLSCQGNTCRWCRAITYQTISGDT